MNLTAIYLAAGVSSRYGGKIKGLTKVGPNNESLIEISMLHAIEAGFNKFVFIVSDKTHEAFNKKFGEEFNNIPIKYCFQTTPEWREKPYGTAHALNSAKNLVDEPFMVLNADDIYGKKTFKKIAQFMGLIEKSHCMPGYKLKNAIPKEGNHNRGLINVNSDYNLISVKEQFNISYNDIGDKYTGEELISMNLFAMQPEFLNYLNEKTKEFIVNTTDTKKEFLLPHVITSYLQEKDIKKTVIPTDDVPIGLTHPGDEIQVKMLISQQNL